MDVRWVTVFLDRPAARYTATGEFWRDVLGATMSPTRGSHAEFATFIPPDGHAFMRIQRTTDGSAGSHIDLHCDDPRAAADEAIALGATELEDLADVVVLESPGGLRFCVVAHHGEHTRPAAVGPAGRGVLLHQCCIDVAPDRHDAERHYWSSLTGWPILAPRSDEFSALVRPDPIPVRLLFQRRGAEDRGADATVHVDISCEDRRAEVARHVERGATLVAARRHWTVMADPVGVEYCLVDRLESSGLLQQR